MPTMRRSFVAAVVTVAALAAGPASSAVAGQDGQHVFLRSASVNASATAATLPLFEGVTSDGDRVFYIVTESSDRDDAARRGVNHAPKLANAVGTTAVQAVTYDAHGRVVFPATVDFSPQRRVTPGPNGFPPAVAEPGAVGENGYTPLVRLPDGTVLNAPHLANDSGRADKVIAVGRDSVVVELTAGFYNGHEVRYISTEATNPVAATLENVTYAPALATAPRERDTAVDSAAASEELAAFTNGRVGAADPERQGLSSALLDGLSPLNVLDEVPGQGRFPDYSPVWDVHLTTWTDAAVAAGANARQTDFRTVEHLAEDGLVTGFGGAAFGPSGFFVNCPVIAELG